MSIHVGLTGSYCKLHRVNLPLARKSCGNDGIRDVLPLMSLISALSIRFVDAGKDSAKGEKGDLETKLGANLGRLWAFSSNLTKGKKVKKVNCMAWNKHNQVRFIILSLNDVRVIV